MKQLINRYCALLGFAFCILFLHHSANASSVLGSPSDFNYAGSPFCQNGPNAFPSSVSSAGQGFFASPTGQIVFANNVTGEINVAASLPGSWIVRRYVGNDSMTRLVTILAPDNSSFSYLVDTACIGSANTILPVVSGMSGGTFAITSGTSIDSLTGSIDLNTTPAGSYVITYTTAGQCPSSSQSTLVFMEVPDAFFSFGSTALCLNNTAISPDSIALPNSGYFHISPATVAMDSLTGAIQPGNAASGTYTVEHVIGGACPSQWQQTLDIDVFNSDPLFDYVDTLHCEAESIFLPVLLGPTNLVFSAQSGLVFDNAAIGSIDPTASTAGTYTVTAELQSNCLETWTQTIMILDSTQVQLTVSGDTLFAPGPGADYQWYLNGAPISGATNATYFAATSGNYEVRYHRVGDECGTIGILAHVGFATATTWLASSKLHPNPSNGKVSYALSLLRPGSISFELYDALGTVVRKGQLGQGAVSFQGQFDFSELPAGNYLIRLIAKEGAVTQKLVLQH